VSERPKNHLERVFAGVNPTMAIASITMVFAFVLFTVTNAELANGIYTGAKAWIEGSLGWYYVAVVSAVLFFTFWVASAASAICAWARTMNAPSSATSPGSPCCSAPRSAPACCSGASPSR